MRLALTESSCRRTVEAMRAEPRVREPGGIFRNGVSWLVLLLIPTGGCFPYVLPPSQLSIGTGATNGYVANSEVKEPAARPAHYNLRGGFHPLGAIEGMADLMRAIVADVIQQGVYGIRHQLGAVLAQPFGWQDQFCEFP